MKNNEKVATSNASKSAIDKNIAVITKEMNNFKEKIKCTINGVKIHAFWEPDDDGSGVYVFDFLQGGDGIEVNCEWDLESWGFVKEDYFNYEELVCCDILHGRNGRALWTKARNLMEKIKIELNKAAKKHI